ncbi:hypothetical protein PAAG_11158 [Paracoccidioides lutzii Pb01]|uniref:Uncharacterized protein n=1 Tax=Paracoccidioides lutzii (strain ATCC MYA-826 / Pb01) TaxID=502779 RepID=A0A0A2V789_PARBA|nr:hypothetical protein PAAG_11158 [Paracoccidioides lutzii Pb01]KGQ01985.1 hypothetical protein PAAG_11158 [Paracoccidioides lutzii Pb01]
MPGLQLKCGWKAAPPAAMTTDNDFSEFDLFIDDVTDDKNDAGPEETGALVWRHIKFHIIRSILDGRPNILLTKVTLLHTKGEEKEQVKRQR